MSWRQEAAARSRERTVQSGEYTSTLFERFVKTVNGLGASAEILDLGPTTADNLMFWARRGHRVAAIDARGRYEAGEPLGLEGRLFGGILAWNVMSAIPAEPARELMTRLEAMLLPGGSLFAIFDGDGRMPPSALRYRIVGEGKLRFEPAADPAPMRPVSANEIETLMRSLKPTRLTVMRHGSREALGQKPGPDRAPFPDAPLLGTER